jgi:hypothetical protein
MRSRQRNENTKSRFRQSDFLDGCPGAPGCSKGCAEYRATAKVRPFCNLSEGLSTPFPLAIPYVKPTSRDGFERTGSGTARFMSISDRKPRLRTPCSLGTSGSSVALNVLTLSTTPAKLTRQPSCHEQQNRLHNQFYPAPVYVFETADPPAQTCDETQH